MMEFSEICQRKRVVSSQPTVEPTLSSHNIPQFIPQFFKYVSDMFKGVFRYKVQQLNRGYIEYKRMEYLNIKEWNI